MKRFWQVAAITLTIFTSLATAVGAETRYISDQLVVSLRAQPQNGSATLTYLKTDTPITVLAEAGEYLKVQTKTGETGYILSKYLTSATPKAMIIRQLKNERDQLAKRATEAQQQVATSKSQTLESRQELTAQLTERQKAATALQNELSESQAELQQIQQQYRALQSDAKEVIAITAERDQLEAANRELATRMSELDKEVGKLARTGAIKWFLAGAGVLFLGWVIGKASANRRRRGF